MKLDHKKIIEIMLTADGGCNTCAHLLLEKLVKEYPEIDKEAVKKYNKEFLEDIKTFLK